MGRVLWNSVDTLAKHGHKVLVFSSIFDRQAQVARSV